MKLHHINSIQFVSCVTLLALTFTCHIQSTPAAGDDAQAAQDATKIQILKRLENIDVNANPKLKTLVLRHLARNKGTEEYVDIVDQFDIRDVHHELAMLAATRPTDNVGVKAARILLRLDGRDDLLKTIDGKDATAALNTLTAVGLVGDKPAKDLLLSIINDTSRSVPVRGGAVRALATSGAGQQTLLTMVESQKMPPLLAPAFTQSLNNATNPSVRAKAAKLLPMPATRDAKPLAPLNELIKRKGNPGHGPGLYQRATCHQCHKAGDLGVDFGPALTEIGSKLSREAMFVSILDPSAGISHNFEGEQIEMEDGASHVGIVVSEADGVILLKQQQGIVQKLALTKIVERRKLPTSIMPAGLTAALTEQELIDLVEWLLTLKKK